MTKRDELSMDKSDVGSEIKILEADTYYEEDQDQQQTYVQDPQTTTNIIYETAATEPLPEFSGSTRSIHISERQVSEEEQEIITMPTKDRKRKNSWNEVDEDDSGNKFFAMSVACSLKRLSYINNLRAKGEIFQILEKYATKEN